MERPTAEQLLKATEFLGLENAIEVVTPYKNVGELIQHIVETAWPIRDWRKTMNEIEAKQAADFWQQAELNARTAKPPTSLSQQEIERLLDNVEVLEKANNLHEAELSYLRALNRQVVDALAAILPFAESNLTDAPSHPGHANLEDARAALFRARGVKLRSQNWTKRIYKCGCTANGTANVPLECPEHGAPIRREPIPGRTDP